MSDTDVRRGARRVDTTRAVVILAVVASTALLSLGGCTVSTGGRVPASPKVEQVLDSGQGHFDLTRPPSREEAGMGPGRSHVTYERADRQAFGVRVALPEGEELDLEARLVVFDSVDSPDPAIGAPTTLDIHHYPATLAAGRDHLLAVAREFGLDPAAVNAWYEEAANPRPAPAPSTVRTPWLSTTVGYGYLEVQGRYAPPVDTPESDRIVVHYVLSWEADPSSGHREPEPESPSAT